MNYRNKRNAKGLSIYTVSSRLGIDYQTYLEVEHGKRHLETERVDKFMEILENSTAIKLERAAKMIKVNEWFESGQARETLSRYGYTAQELGKKIGTSQANISWVLCGRYEKNDDLKERIYDFLNDNLNINIKQDEAPKVKNTHSKTKNTVEIKTEDHSKDENIVEKEKIKVSLPVSDETVRLQKENEKLKEIVNAFVKLANRL